MMNVPQANAMSELIVQNMRETALKCASTQTAQFARDFAHPNMMPQRTMELADMYLYYLTTGNVIEFESEGEVDEMSKMFQYYTT